MKRAEFNSTDINQAIAEYVQSNEPRIVPSIGKNGDITVYGNNENPHKPTLFKEEDNGTSKELDPIDIGTA